jgi:uncharacterized protein (TIGR03083 family)
LGFLEALRIDDWDGPTLCDDWRVRDVVAHLIPGWAADVRHLPYVVRNRDDIDRGFAEYARARAEVDVDVLLAQYRAKVDSRHVPLVVTPALNWCDNVIHSLDIRRAQGIRYPGRKERLAEVAELLGDMTWPSRQACRSDYVRLVATDLEWSYGTGPEVVGPIEDIVLAIAGRKVKDWQLTGDGYTIVAARD